MNDKYPLQESGSLYIPENPLKGGVFQRIPCRPVNARYVKSEMTRFCRKMEELDTRTFTAITDSLAAHGYHLGMTLDDENLVIYRNPNFVHISSVKEILNMCKRWNMISLKNTKDSYEIAVLEEESEELGLLMDCVRRQRKYDETIAAFAEEQETADYAEPEQVYETETPSRLLEQLKRTSPKPSLTFLESLYRNSDLLDEVDIAY